MEETWHTTPPSPPSGPRPPLPAPPPPPAAQPAGGPLARIARAGPAALDDHELLGLVGIDVDAATLAAAGGLREVLDDPHDTLRLFLLSAEDRARVHAVHELHARWMEARMRRHGALTSPSHTRRYLEARLRGLRNEVFVAVFLDSRNRPVACEELFRGTVDSATVHPRVVVRRALMHNAAALVVAHCHCSGSAEPSPADRALTRRLAEALALVDVRLVDHFVVGDGECASFAEMGLL